MRNSVKRLAVLAITMIATMPVAAWSGSSFSTINKSIRLESGTSAGDVESVNGAIRIGDDSVVESVESVNGSIRIGDGVKVERDIEAVNGAIELGQGSDVGGSIESVNGSIKLRHTQVADHVQTVNGDIHLLDGTIVEGYVKVKKPRGWSSHRNKPVKVEIGENVQVMGDLVFEQPVELKLHPSARVGDVIGDEVTVIED